jgi:hypothetical protein
VSLVINFLETLWSTLFDVIPVIAVLIGFQLGVIRQRIRQPRRRNNFSFRRAGFSPRSSGI